MKALLVALLAALVAASGCDDKRRFDDDDDGSSDSDADGDTDTESESDSYTGPEYDCDDLPSEPISFTELNAPRGFHDVAFDDAGHIVGGDGSALLKVTAEDEVSVFVASIGQVQGMDYLPNGDLIVAEDMNGRILRVDPSGSYEAIANDVYAYGVTADPLGGVFVANNSMLRRIDPDTMESVTYSAGSTPRAVNFSPDLSRLYHATHDGSGSIHYLELDENLEQIGGPTLLASGVGGVWMDGLGVDACGNLYVPVYDNHTLYRISPEGVVEIFYTWPQLQPYGHGLEWGTGENGWSQTALYMPQPYDMSTVLEVEIGVPSRTIWDG
jgi:sugar lactone lactonase YvrE